MIRNGGDASSPWEFALVVKGLTGGLDPLCIRIILVAPPFSAGTNPAKNLNPNMAMRINLNIDGCGVVAPPVH